MEGRKLNRLAALPVALLILIPGLLPSLRAQETGERGTLPGVEKILAAALEVAERYEGEEVRARFSHRVRTSSEKLDDDGKVVSAETTRKRALPIQGFLFEELIEKDGRPLSPDEKESEEERKQEFLEQIREGRDPNEDERQRVFFDQKLIDKYEFDLLGIKERANRKSFVLSFRPKAGDLPVETRMDRALNKSEGEIWIDCDEYELSFVRFELREKIRIWWGFVGSISEMRGSVERTKVSEGIWLPAKFALYLNGKIFFRALHRQETIEWSDFQPVKQTTKERSPVATKLLPAATGSN